MHTRAVTSFRRAGVSCGGVASVFLLASAVAAQRSISIDMMGASLRYADTLKASALSISPALSLQTSRVSLLGSGTFSQLGSAGWSTQGALRGGVYVASAGPFVAELTGSAGASAHEDGNRTGRWLAGVRGHVLGSGSGLWVGGGIGRARDGVAWRTVQQLDLGGWAGRAGRSALLSLTPSIVDDTIRYIDAQLALDWAVRRLEWSALAGFRAGDRLAALGGTQQAWGSVSVVAWVTPWAGLVASAGTYPVDLTQGFPGGRFITLGMRLRPAQRERAAVAAASNGESDARAGAAIGGFEAFQAVPIAPGKVTLRVRVTHARRVEVNGDFTAWQPIPLTPAGKGWWTVTLPIEPGTYQMAARRDGGEWVVPPGLTAVVDEFGGKVGILVVSGDEAR